MFKKHLLSITSLLIAGALMVGCQQVNAIELDTAKAAAQAEVEVVPTGERNTANVISLDPNHANSYKTFAPELEKTLARTPQLDPETQLYVEEIEPNLFYVTGGIYQSAFLKTDEGIVVLDAPPSFAHKLPAVIAEHAPNVPITHLVYSHGHTDHVGGAAVFGDVQGLEVVAPAKVAVSIAEEGAPTILQPTMTYEDNFELEVGGEIIELKTATFHAEDEDVIIYLPKQKFLMAVDTITTGEVPFMNFGGTSDVGEYLSMFDELLAYDFDYLLSGHLSILANRDDVLENKEYAFDVQASVINGMQTFQQRFGEILAAMEFRSGNLAYRSAIEQVRGECSAEIIDKWQDKLSAVDIWADSHCETMVIYYIMH
ncbi:MBL fold metallo-hydrolase [Chloroflexi bacterium TSY]|nr:MBL fold metallo-hydrolase [Chloroflexi bacterium TSY]